jgi:hypothetical protein
VAYNVSIGTYLLGSVNEISAVHDGRHRSVDLTVVLFPNDLGRLFEQYEANTPAWGAGVELFKHETTTLSHFSDSWRVDNPDLLKWARR